MSAPANVTNIAARHALEIMRLRAALEAAQKHIQLHERDLALSKIKAALANEQKR